MNFYEIYEILWIFKKIRDSKFNVHLQVSNFKRTGITEIYFKLAATLRGSRPGVQSA